MTKTKVNLLWRTFFDESQFLLQISRSYKTDSKVTYKGNIIDLIIYTYYGKVDMWTNFDDLGVLPHWQMLFSRVANQLLRSK